MLSEIDLPGTKAPCSNETNPGLQFLNVNVGNEAILLLKTLPAFVTNKSCFLSVGRF